MSIRTQRICTCPGINAVRIVNNLNNGIAGYWEIHILVRIGGIVLSTYRELKARIEIIENGQIQFT
jgi:hypothetical protein